MRTNRADNRLKVIGICYKHSNLKKYILWALKLLEDMPAIFSQVEFCQANPSEQFDIYLVDDLDSHRKHSNVWTKEKIIIHMKSKISHPKWLPFYRFGWWFPPKSREIRTWIAGPLRIPLNRWPNKTDFVAQHPHSSCPLAANWQPNVLLCAFADDCDQSSTSNPIRTWE